MASSAHERRGAHVDLEAVLVDRPRDQPDHEQRGQRPSEQQPLGEVAAAEVLQRGGDEGGGTHRSGPRRTGVRRLIEHHAQPRHEEQPADDDGHEHSNGPAAVVARGVPRPPRQHDDGGRDQPQRPVVRQQQRAGDEHDAGQAQPRETLERVRHQQVAGEHEEHDQRVHAGLGAVANGERRQRQQGHERPRGDPAPDAAAGQPGERKGEHREHTGQRAHGGVAFAEDRHPAVKQEVVQRRVPVVAQRARDVAQRQPGDVDAQRFIEPKVRSGPEAQHHADDDGRGDHHELDRSERGVAGIQARTGARWHGERPMYLGVSGRSTMRPYTRPSDGRNPTGQERRRHRCRSRGPHGRVSARQGGRRRAGAGSRHDGGRHQPHGRARRMALRPRRPPLLHQGAGRRRPVARDPARRATSCCGRA